MSNFVNLTPHPITFKFNNESITFQPSGKVARIISNGASQHDVVTDGIIISYVNPGIESLVDLPEPQDNTFYIVSSLVLNYLRSIGSHRKDVVAPGTGPKDGAIRDEKGNIVAITKFIGIA